MMEIKIERCKTPRGRFYFIADFADLSGSPPIGTGWTKQEAVATLFIRNYDRLQKISTLQLKMGGRLYSDPIRARR